jgi:hypothetical protein
MKDGTVNQTTDGEKVEIWISRAQVKEFQFALESIARIIMYNPSKVHHVHISSMVRNRKVMHM